MATDSTQGKARIIEAAELMALMAAAQEPNPPQQQLLLLQVTSPEAYQAAHLEGARLVTPSDLVSGTPPATGRLPDQAKLTQLFTRIGFDPKKQVVVYDDEGGGWAGRLAWTLDIIGYRNWWYLNGGITAWQLAGLPIATGPDTQAAQTDVALATDQTPIAEIPDVLAAIEDPATLIWDVRSADEFAGRRQASARVGHIPGAINYDWMMLKDPRDQRVTDDCRAKLAAAGIDGSRRLITHCQTHHRSGLSYMLGRLFGWDIRAYHGSWSEWGNRDDTPVEI